MAGRKVTIEFLGKDHSAGRTASDLEQKFGKLGARMNRVGQVSGRILAGGLLLVAAAAVKAGQAAADDELAQAKLAQTLRKATGATDAQIASIEDWITQQGMLLGVTDDELRPAISKLAAATGDVTEAQKLATLAMDVSAGAHKDLNQVVEALQKAQNGSVGGLSRLGVATKNAAGETKSFDEIQKDLAKTYSGAAAAAADTTAGKQKILQTRFAELQEEVGERLQPALLRLTDAGLKVVDWIERNQTTTAVLAGTIGGLLAVTWGVTKAIAVWTAVTKLAAAAQIIFTNVQWALNIAMSANPIGLVVAGLVLLVGGLILAYKKSDTFRAIVDKAFSVVGAAAKWMWENAIKPAFAGIKVAIEAVGKAGTWLWNNALQPAFKFIISGVAKILEMWADMLKTLGKVPGFGWAKSAADAMQNAANKANTLANNLTKIKDKDVTVTIRYRMLGGPGRDDPDYQGHGPSRTRGRSLGDVLETSGKKGEKALERLRDSLSKTRELFKGLKDSVAGAFTSGLFDATNSTDFVSNLSSTSGKLGALKAAFKTLTGWGLKPAFLAQLFQSGNADLILDLAKNQASAVEAGTLFGGITAASGELGGMVAQNQYGEEIASLQSQIAELKGGKGRVGDTYNLNVSMGLVTDPVAAGREMVKAFRQLERATGRQFLVSAS